MKKCIASLVLFLAAFNVGLASIVQPVSWGAKVVKLEDGNAQIRLTGTIQENWHIYDISDYGPDGPNPTVLEVRGVRLVGSPYIESAVEREYDSVFGMEIGTCSREVVLCQNVELSGGNASVTVEWQACSDESCLPVEEWSTTLAMPSAKSIWGLILEAILWGLLALLTPCVFPMIPMTVSYFLKQKKGAKGLAGIYGLSIVALYTLPIAVIILITYFAGGETVTADIFNWLSTHWLPNIVFFLVFMAFAASFFGAFEFVLPSSWLTRADAKSGRSGLAGVFFLALTTVLVSFSCTGPIVGSVLIKSTQGSFWEPIVTILAFSLAFALPFTLFAMVPSLLDRLPKSGPWLGEVKKVLGFVELALGMKFLSVADQTYHWGLLDREVYLAVWIVIFTLLGLYLMGKIRFKDDAPLTHIGISRLALIILDLSFVVYMIPGMFGAPLKAISGYLPPMTTQDFVISRYAPSPSKPATGGRKYADFLKLPLGLDGYFDYDEARAEAIRTGKPLFVDFTGHGCVNCREMEARVWSDPRVLRMLREDYVVCSLYGDDKTVLDSSEWVTTESGKTLKSLGKINSYFVLRRFNVNSQPFYAILDPVTEVQKVPSRAYDLDVDAYLNFLSAGLD